MAYNVPLTDHHEVPRRKNRFLNIHILCQARCACGKPEKEQLTSIEIFAVCERDQEEDDQKFKQRLSIIQGAKLKAEKTFR